MQTINSINLCIECTKDLISTLGDTNEFKTHDLRILNMYGMPTSYCSEIPFAHEQDCLYSRLHVSCQHERIFNISHDDKKPRSEYDVKGILHPDTIKLTNDTRHFIVNDIVEQLHMKVAAIKAEEQLDQYL
jgi:hypothetical protein